MRWPGKEGEPLSLLQFPEHPIYKLATDLYLLVGGLHLVVLYLLFHNKRKIINLTKHAMRYTLRK